jgi:hypothetical protein
MHAQKIVMVNNDTFVLYPFSVICSLHIVFIYDLHSSLWAGVSAVARLLPFCVTAFVYHLKKNNKKNFY